MKRNILFAHVLLGASILGSSITFAGSDLAADSHPPAQDLYKIEKIGPRVQSNSVKDPVDKIIASPPPAAVIANAKAMYHKIMKVSSVVESKNINYKRYIPMVGDLKADYDIFSSEQRDYPELVSLLGVPVKHFIWAADYWTKSIEGDPNTWSADDNSKYKLRNVDGRDKSFKSAKDSIAKLDDIFYKLISESNPADEFSGKKFWFKKSHSFSDGYHKGKCTDEGRLKSYFLDNDKFTPKGKQTFVVDKYFPGTSTFDSKIEVIFEGNQVVCAELYKIIDGITTEHPERNEKIVSEKLKTAGLSVGKYLWLKHPNKHMAGLTKVMIEKIDIAFDDIIEFTIGSEDYDSYTDALTINELLDRMYLKLPGKFKKLSKKVANAIENQQVVLGMTSDQAIASWGEPSSVNRTAGSWGMHEQWVYGDKTYLYFKNGKLTSWQD